MYYILLKKILYPKILPNIAQRYRPKILSKDIAQRYCPILPKYIAQYCPKILPKDIAPRYCPKILPKDIAPRYCPKILPKDIAQRYCPKILPNIAQKFSKRLEKISQEIVCKIVLFREKNLS